ncbi:sensor histidine kinase [Actinoplanes sp. N902-109]|uniref:sensor histidine kinase n=1 Tax=Actinoplanes sp. (strain N902-109) TaxID=649831 RepID=UPI00068684A3|nr:histidine kinase [Actinoplanes sp. N902-109]
MLATAFVTVLFWLPTLLRSDGWARISAGVLLAGLAAAAMLLRDRHPGRATWTAAIATVAGTALGACTDPMLATAWCLYPLAVRQATRLRRPALLLSLLVAVVAVVAAVPDRGFGRPLLVSIVALTVAWLLGTTVGRQLEAERSRLHLAVARDVHDVVGQSLGAISAEAGVVAALPDADERELRETLAGIETHARSALGTIQTLVRTLRAPAAPAPLTARIALPAGSGTAAYWILQEALTNVLRHAPGAACDVDVHDENGTTVIVVRDHGPGAPATDGGFGLRGMRERAELAGGTLSWRNHPAGGFEIQARLP